MNGARTRGEAGKLVACCEPCFAGVYVLRSRSPTRRGSEVLELIGRGLSNKEIGRQLCLSVATVKHHVHHVLEKLGLSRRAEAMRRVRDAPWIVRLSYQVTQQIVPISNVVAVHEVALVRFSTMHARLLRWHQRRGLLAAQVRSKHELLKERERPPSALLVEPHDGHRLRRGDVVAGQKLGTSATSNASAMASLLALWSGHTSSILEGS